MADDTKSVVKQRQSSFMKGVGRIARSLSFSRKEKKPREKEAQSSGAGNASSPSSGADQQSVFLGWLEYTDEASGRPYYYNVHTKATTWYKPTGAEEIAASRSPPKRDEELAKEDEELEQELEEELAKLELEDRFMSVPEEFALEAAGIAAGIAADDEFIPALLHAEFAALDPDGQYHGGVWDYNKRSKQIVLDIRQDKLPGESRNTGAEAASAMSTMVGYLSRMYAASLPE